MNTRPRLECNNDGDVLLVEPMDGGAGDDRVTLLGHISAPPDVPAGLEEELIRLHYDWRDGLSFAAGCRAACDAAYEAAISGGLRP